MTHGDLKIVRVYTQDGKQVAFDVQNAAGIQRVDKVTVVGAIKNGHSYVNATVTSSGVVRVDANVPRQPLQRKKLKVQAILYSPAIVREGALGALVKCNNEVKACTYDEFCSTVNNYECDLDDREAVVHFNPKKPFKNGYKYIDISKKDFLKSKVYEMSTPALKAVVDKIQSSGGSLKSQSTNPDNPEIKYPIFFTIFGEHVKVGYYDKPNNYKPVDVRFTRVTNIFELTENDDYYYFTTLGNTYYTKIEFKRVANDDYMTIVLIQAIEQFYKDLAICLKDALYHGTNKLDKDSYYQLKDELPNYNYQYISQVYGKRDYCGICIHDAALPFDAIGASADSFGDTVFRTKYAFDKIQAAYCNCIRILKDIGTGKVQSIRCSIESQSTNPEIHYPIKMRVLGENIKIGYYDTPNNLKPVDFHIDTNPYPLSEDEDDDYVYFSLGSYTYYIRLDYKHIDTDDYMTDMTLNALNIFYGHLGDAIYQESKHIFKDHYRRILDDLLKYPYQYPQALLGDHEKYGIHIHNMVPPFDAIGAGNGSYGDCVFRTKYAYDKIKTCYSNCIVGMNRLYNIVTGKEQSIGG